MTHFRTDIRPQATRASRARRQLDFEATTGASREGLVYIQKSECACSSQESLVECQDVYDCTWRLVTDRQRKPRMKPARDKKLSTVEGKSAERLHCKAAAFDSLPSVLPLFSLFFQVALDSHRHRHRRGIRISETKALLSELHDRH